jgi:signal transduction histidine kinase/CheY-like chemotaxis protein
MRHKEILRAIFGVRFDPNYQLAPFAAFYFPLAMLAISLSAYLLSSPKMEYEFRMTFLATAGMTALVLLVHLARPQAARWIVVLSCIALVLTIAFLWEDANLLYLLVIPPMLAVIFVNVPSGILIAGVESVLIVYLSKHSDVFFLYPQFMIVLLFNLWIAALLVAGGFYLVERVLARATEDYDRLQGMLENSRDHQARLAEALDDLAHANRQLSLLFEKNVALRKAAEEATEAKSTYIARVSHEIRTPLNMILGITDLIIENHEEYDADLPIDLMEDIRIIRRNSDHLLSLVNDVLDLTHAETGHMVLKKDWVDIIPEVERSLEIVMPLARKKHLQLQFEHPDILPQVYCDRTRIRQVIVNLVSNAVRYTEQGMVSVWAFADEGWLTLQIKDTGPGIHPADAERIFEPFVRGMNSTRQETSGSGLGLSVSRQLLDVHGGKIWLESQPGMGSIFAFKLPLNNLEPPRSSPARFLSERWAWVERKRSWPAESSSKKKRLILYEPEEFLGNLLIEHEEQVEFIRLQSIPAMIETANTAPAHLVLINAPTMSDLLVKVEQAARGIRETPIIGCAFIPSRQKVIESGAVEYIQKPFSTKKLRAVLQKVSPTLHKVLIIDDNIEVQQLIARVLSLHNEAVEILLAGSAAEAMAILAQKQPDAILLDLALPDINGWNLMTQLKKDPRYANIPIVIISAHDLNEAAPSTRAIVLAQNGGVSAEQFINFTLASLQAQTGASG